MTVGLRYAIRSDKGLVRGNNEDSVYAGPRLLAIADGMGGHAGGEVASKIVIGAVEDLDEDRPVEDLITSLREAVEDANTTLSLAVERNPDLEGMGTTLTALRFSGTKVGLVHVGDSRAYLLRDGQLTQITHDDTYVQSLVDAGRLTLEEASHHPRKSVILRALNGADLEPDISIREARQGDRYLLCTDGLTDVLRAETLHEALAEGDAQECADRLVALALRGGGPDNVTCIVADVVEPGRGDDVPVVAGAVVDPAEQTADDESPAARAAGLGTSAGVPVKARRGERRWPRVVVPVIIVLVLAGAAVGTWIWTQTQYFVGSDHGTVAVFQGVDTELGPLKFYSMVSASDVQLSDLKPVVRAQVSDGITARDRADADAIVSRLKSGQLLPICPAVTPTPTTTPTHVSTTTPRVTPTATPTARTTAKSTAQVHREVDGQVHRQVHRPRDHRCPPDHGRRDAVHPRPHADPVAGPDAGRRDRLQEPPMSARTGDTQITPLPGAPSPAAPRTRTGRAAELYLLVFAVLIVAAAEAVVEATLDGRIGSHVVSYAAIAAVLAAVTHLTVWRTARYADPVLVPCVVLLNGLGLVMIHRIDLALKQVSVENGTTFDGASAPTQVVWTAVGLVLFVAIMIIVRDHRVLARFGYTVALVGLFFLALPAVLPARYSEVYGARIWIKVAGFSIQPGEFAKIALTIFAASYLVTKRDVLALAGRKVLGLELPRGRDLGPVLLAWLISIGVLVRGHDLGTSLMFFGLFIVLLYVATERVSWVVIGLVLFAGGTVVAYHLFTNLHTRVTVWLHAFDYEQGIGYQLTQSLFGLGTGGMFGTGLGGGSPESVPVVKTDFILSAFGEELGLFGLVAILAIYALLIFRGMSAGLLVRDSFSKLLATGLSFSLGLQLFVVAAGVTRLLPETGLTTPFLSYGGSSLVANYALLALLVKISDAARRPAQPVRPVPPASVAPAEAVSA